MLYIDEHGRIRKWFRKKDTTRQATLDEGIETIRVNSIKAFENWRQNDGKKAPQE